MEKIGFCNAEKGIICNCFRPPTALEQATVCKGRDLEYIDMCDPNQDESHGGKTAGTCQYREEINE